jgi:hypothetical protein
MESSNIGFENTIPEIGAIAIEPNNNAFFIAQAYLGCKYLI